MVHFEIVQRAEKFLKAMNCKIVIRDPFKALTMSGEAPDAIGWKSGVSFLIEVKTSRSDFLADKKKRFRIKPEQGMGDWRFYMCPPEIIKPDDLPEGWGLLWIERKTITVVKDVDRTMHRGIISEYRHEVHPRSDRGLLYSIARRRLGGLDGI